MSVVMAKSQQLYRNILLVTLLLTVGLTALLWGFGFAALSFMLGCFIAWFSQLAFVVFLFARQRALPFNAKVKALYQAQGVKFGVTVMLFIIILRIVNVHAGAFFSGYLLVILCHGVLPFLLSKGKC